MSDKRFQECNWYEKLWRYRFYLAIPFKWLYHMYIKPLPVYETAMDEKEESVNPTGEVWNPRGKGLWGLLIGMAQGDMNWTYTMEEVFDRVGYEKYEWCECEEPNENYKLTEWDEPYCMCLTCDREIQNPSKWEKDE